MPCAGCAPAGVSRTTLLEDSAAFRLQNVDVKNRLAKIEEHFRRPQAKIHVAAGLSRRALKELSRNWAKRPVVCRGGIRFFSGCEEHEYIIFFPWNISKLDLSRDVAGIANDAKSLIIELALNLEV